MTRPVWIAMTVLLTVHTGLVSWAIFRNSVVVDEVNHLPAGVSYLQMKTFEVYHQNPPLVKLLGAAAALAAGARADYSGFWRHARVTGTEIHYVGFGHDFQMANVRPPGQYHRIYRAARVVVLLFSLAGALLVFFWARQLFGDVGGLISMALWCLSPNVIANAAMLTTDLPATVMMFAATWAFWAWLRRPTWPATAAVGLLLGLAQLTKFSALILFLVWPLLALPVLWRRAWPDDSGPTSLQSRISLLASRGAVILGICVLVVNAGYLFQGSGRKLGEFDFLSQALTREVSGGFDSHPLHPYREVYKTRVNLFRGTWFEAFPVPLPEHYVLGFDEQTFEMKPGVEGYHFTVYLRGEVSTSGWWYYFLYALLVKSTPGAYLA